MIRTRFAPSPTGMLHIGGVRTALFSWAFAKHNNGQFFLRIEDTDLVRSTQQSTQVIIDGMNWLGFDYDGDIVYQKNNNHRHKEMIQYLLDTGNAYYCYSTKDELESLRQEQQTKGLKPKYDNRWRPENGKVLPPIPKDVKPVIRFKNPLDGVVEWNDLVKGKICISNTELDDLIIARSDGSPTYNFCVVVDDYDMKITHVIRGDDHVNNTPRQINILKAFGADIPEYAHLPMILNSDGKKMSKRRDVVSITDYQQQGILPEALLNYLARLGWSNGDIELFNIQQFVDWFDLKDINSSPSRFDIEKLLWVNKYHISTKLASSIMDEYSPMFDITFDGPNLEKVIDLLKDKHNNINDLINDCNLFYKPVSTDKINSLEQQSIILVQKFVEYMDDYDGGWEYNDIDNLLKEFCNQNNIKLVDIAMPLRILLLGVRNTPDIKKVLQVFGYDLVISRLKISL